MRNERWLSFRVFVIVAGLAVTVSGRDISVTDPSDTEAASGEHLSVEQGVSLNAPSAVFACAGDANADTTVNIEDITTILSNWGSIVSLIESREGLMGRRFITGDIAITILGDSTNNPNQGITFVPDHYGILARRTDDICGFGIGTTTGGARFGGNAFVAVAGGGNSNYVGDVQMSVLPPTISATSRADRVPLGDHADWKVKKISEGDTIDGDISNFGPTYRIDIKNLAGLFPARGDWLAGGWGRIRIPFLRHPEGVPGCVGELNLQTFEDFNDDGVYSVALTNRNVQIAGSETGLIAFDSDVGGTGVTPSGRIRLEVRARSPNGSGNYAGKSILFGSPIVYNADAVDRGFYLDTLSIGGWTVALHWANTTQQQLHDWRSIQPRPAQYLWIYLGQNDILIDAAWEARFIELGERAEGAGFIPVMVVPPSVSEFATGKAIQMREVFGRLRASKGWPVLDIDAKLGRRLSGPELFDQIHRTMTGALVIADTIRAIMQEYADREPESFGDTNADSAVNFADLTAVLSNWGAVCP